MEINSFEYSNPIQRSYVSFSHTIELITGFPDEQSIVVSSQEHWLT
jgi:hypothetical protein